MNGSGNNIAPKSFVLGGQGRSRIGDSSVADDRPTHRSWTIMRLLPDFSIKTDGQHYVPGGSGFFMFWEHSQKTPTTSSRCPGTSFEPRYGYHYCLKRRCGGASPPSHELASYHPAELHILSRYGGQSPNKSHRSIVPNARPNSQPRRPKEEARARKKAKNVRDTAKVLKKGKKMSVTS